MAIRQSIWSLDNRKELNPSKKYLENDIEILFFEHIDALNSEWLVIGRQILTDYGGKIDLLCMDVGGNLIVVELKRDKTPREITAQVLDYASWISSLVAGDIAIIFEEKNNGKTIDDAYREKFGQDLDGDNINTNPKMVIAAELMDDSTERIIHYLNSFGLEINVLFFQVFEYRDERLISRAWMIEEGDGEAVKTRASTKVEWNGEFYNSFGEGDQRTWKDALKYGFTSAGGGSWYSGTLRNVGIGDRIWVNIPRVGYVGVGEVVDAVKPCSEVELNVNGKLTPFYEIDTFKGRYHADLIGTVEEEHLVKVKWIHAVPIPEAVSESGFFGNQNIICKPTNGKWQYTIERLKKIWEIE